jgi:hypothetical protein
MNRFLTANDFENFEYNVLKLHLVLYGCETWSLAITLNIGRRKMMLYSGLSRLEFINVSAEIEPIFIAKRRPGYYYCWTVA